MTNARQYHEMKQGGIARIARAIAVFAALGIGFAICFDTLASPTDTRLVVAVDASGWPYSFRDDDGQIKGFAIDLIRHIATQEAWNLEVIELLDAERSLQLANGEIDITLPFARKLGENRFHLVEEAFAIAWGSLFVARADRATSVFHIDGYRVAVVADDYFGNRFRDLSDNLGLKLSFIETESAHAAFELVRNGAADASAVEEIAGGHIAPTYNLRTIDVRYAHTPAHFGVSLNRGGATATAISTALGALKKDKTSYYYTALDKWYGALMEPPLPSWFKKFLFGMLAVIGSLAVFGFMLMRQLNEKRREIVRREALEAELTYNTLFDDLTDLPNRRQLFQTIAQEIKVHGVRGEKFHVAIMDLDNFKRIVDTKGHQFGDQVLQAVSRRMSEHFSNDYTLARFGGDEYVILGSETGGREIDETIDRIGKVFSTPFAVAEEEVFITTSVGFSSFPENGTGTVELLKTADTALYHGKASGKNTRTKYSPEIHLRNERTLVNESLLRQALRDNLCGAHYQPIVELSSGQPHAAEALFRCFHPKLKGIDTAHLISIADETGLITEIGEVMLAAACKQFKAWQSAGLNLEYIAVNLSLEQIFRTDVVKLTEEALLKHDMNPNSLVLEITEAVFMKDPDQVMGVLRDIRRMGVNLALDDFGTGYSSLAYMKSLPFSKLKLDRIFIEGLPDDLYDTALVKAIVSLGKTFDMAIVAEGVEKAEQAAYLREIGCPIAQGYLFGKPMSADAFFNTYATKIISDPVRSRPTGLDFIPTPGH